MDKSRILLLGSSGQLGKTLFNKLKDDFDLFTLNRPEIDLVDLNNLKAKIKNIKPEIIINAAAYTDVDSAETNIDLAHKINSEAPLLLARISKGLGSLLIHFSTDYVFDGMKKSAYLETDELNPLNVYGDSKMEGEKAILGSGCKAIILRTSWVYSSFRNNFLLTILNLASTQEKIKIINDQVGAPTSTELITKVTLDFIYKYRADKNLQMGLYHLSPSGETSWYGFAKEIIRLSFKENLHSKVMEKDILPISTLEYPLPAKRPKNSVLDCSKLSNTLDVNFLPWQSYLDKVIKQIIQKKL